MYATSRNRTLLDAAFSTLALIYHCIVRDIRKSSGSASLGLLTELMQSLLMVLMMYIMYEYLGMKAATIRGDFIVFLLTGIFLFQTHNKAISSVMGADNPTSPIMKHAPMSTPIAIAASSLAGLYLQVCAMILIIIFVDALRGGLEIHDPARLLKPFFLAWASGVGVGLLFLGAKPFASRLVPLIANIYRRANMITSGKMIPANTMALMGVNLHYFSWNPLFHCIDQARGAAFVNYEPHYSSPDYALWFTLVACLLGLMGEHWLRRNMSSSWGKR